jgi:aconitate hydratase
VAKLPFSIRFILESAVRNATSDPTSGLSRENVETILNWENTSKTATEIQFVLSRVLLQDFTGVPAVVDLAAMRNAVARLGGDPKSIQPRVPVDLVIDHSVQVDKFGTSDALQFNLEAEFRRNAERFVFLKWGANAFNNMRIVPPGSGIVHQVNLEYLARLVFASEDTLYLDTLVGTDSHTPMVNGLGVLGWGVGGIEAEAAMLGEPISMVLPQVVGYKLTGVLPPLATATDLVLTIVRNLRQVGVVDKFVEFYGPGVASLSIADRATISNMAPEYGATVGFFPADQRSVEYLRQTGRSEEHIERVVTYLKANNMFRDYTDASQDPTFSTNLTLDLASIVPSLSGPKRPHDYVALTDMKADFAKCLTNPVGFKGFAIAQDQLARRVSFTYDGKPYEIGHGSVVLAAITSCTNTSNPSVLVAAGLLARNASAKGLHVNPYVKTSLSPGSGVVTEYLKASNLLHELEKQGFYLTGYGCQSCIGNSGPLPKEVAAAIESGDLVAAGVLSGNRNFEGRIHPHIRANYLASPPLVIAYALAGRLDFDFATEELAPGVFLKDLWPSQAEIQEVVSKFVTREQFESVYAKVTRGTAEWNALKASSDFLYPWDDVSTYIHHPPFFQTMGRELPAPAPVKGARCLGFFGDSITTDHISPAGNIARKSPAGVYLAEHGVAPADFNSYGSRRGNDLVMARGTFANIRIVNKLVDVTGPKTKYLPTGEVLPFYNAAMKYKADGTPLIIIAGSSYGSGSSRDWAAKGVSVQQVSVVLAKDFERIHRSNLLLFGVLPLRFKDGESAETYGLTGTETFDINISAEILVPSGEIVITTDTGKSFSVIIDIRTPSEMESYRNGGVLHKVIRKQVA